MKKSGLIITLTCLLLSSCTTEYNDYYYDKENLHWFICYSDHYVVAKDLGDSLQIWNLLDHCNSGYGAAESILIEKKEGATGRTKNFSFKIEITKVTNKRIKLKLNSGGQIIDFSLSRQTSNEKAFRIINIVKMLKINREMEDYIHAKSSKAKPNRNYLLQNYIVDEKVEELNPDEFSVYFRNKQLTQAQTIVKELDEN